MRQNVWNYTLGGEIKAAVAAPRHTQTHTHSPLSAPRSPSRQHSPPHHLKSNITTNCHVFGLHFDLTAPPPPRPCLPHQQAPCSYYHFLIQNVGSNEKKNDNLLPLPYFFRQTKLQASGRGEIIAPRHGHHLSPHKKKKPSHPPKYFWAIYMQIAREPIL